jgi:Na+-transporting NADH:ubiquinone oxidoreductase subunit C
MKETKLRIFTVSLIVSLFFSFLVSLSVYLLKEKQDFNIKQDRLKHILSLVDQKDLEMRIALIDIKTGDYEFINSDTDFFKNFRLLSTDQTAIKIKKDEDIIGIGSHPSKMPAYLFFKNGNLERVVLFVYGNGLWSTMYGFIGISGDLNTITGITFFDQKETPGLGGEVDNPNWKKLWKGKKLFDEMGNFRFKVSKGIDEYSVDGLSGATMTTKGVNNIIKFWFGLNGYGKFLRKIKGNIHGN